MFIRTRLFSLRTYLVCLVFYFKIFFTESYNTLPNPNFDEANFNIPLIQYTRNDLSLIERFVNALKDLNGEWSKYGLQRIVRLNSLCSQNYVSLRNYNRIKADVPIEEAFKDSYTLIEKQIFRKFTALRSKQTLKYVCYQPETGNFILKDISLLDKYCIFQHTVKSQNLNQFSIGSNKMVHFAFNKIGRMLNQNPSTNIFKKQTFKNPNMCKVNQSNLFYVHTKLTDIVADTQYGPIFLNEKNNFYFIPKITTTTSTTTTTTTTTTTRRHRKTKIQYRFNQDQTEQATRRYKAIRNKKYRPTARPSITQSWY